MMRISSGMRIDFGMRDNVGEGGFWGEGESRGGRMLGREKVGELRDSGMGKNREKKNELVV